MNLLIQRSALFVFSCLMLGWSGGMQGYSQGFVPYLQTPTDTSVWISWKTGSGTGTVVHYGIDSTLLDQTVSGAYEKLVDPDYTGDYYYHSVQLKSLQPSTRYFYKASTASSESIIYSFKT